MGSKRKAHAAGHLPPAIKMQRVAGPPRPSDQVAGPYAVHFPTGFAPTAPGRKGDAECEWLAFGRTGNSAQQAIVARTGAVDFVATNYVHDGHPPAHRLYIGVLDKRTGVLQYAPVHARQLLAMEPAYQNAELLQQTTVDDGQGSARVDALGSIREQRNRERAQAGRVAAQWMQDAGHVAGLLGHQAQRAQQEQRTRAHLEDAAAQSARVLPPHHPEESVLERAYRVSELLPEEVRRTAPSGRLLKASEEPEYRDQVAAARRVPEYVLARLDLLAPAQGAQQGQGQQQRQQRARVLAVLGSLLALCGPKGGKILRIDVEQGGSGNEELAKRLSVKAEHLDALLPLFYSRGEQRWEASKPQRDLLVAYVLVLALIADGGHLQPAQYELLRAALRIDDREMAKRLAEVGAVCKRPAGKSTPGRVCPCVARRCHCWRTAGPSRTASLRSSRPSSSRASGEQPRKPSEP